MPDGSQTFSPRLPVLIECERSADLIRQRSFDYEAAHCRGLSLYVGERPSLRSDVELEAAARRILAAQEARAKSPIGRLYKALADLDTLSWGAEVWTMRAALDRAGSDVDGRTVGLVIAVLAKINHSTAREALEACAELLLQERKAA